MSMDPLEFDKLMKESSKGGTWIVCASPEYPPDVILPEEVVNQIVEEFIEDSKADFIIFMRDDDSPIDTIVAN